MARTFRLSITQQFLIFFIITSLLPIAFISTLLFQAIDDKFDEHVVRMLDVGGLFAKKISDNSLDELAISIHQAATLSLNPAVNQTVSQTSSLGSSIRMQPMLDNYRALAGLDFVAVYNPQGVMVASSGWRKYREIQSYQALLSQALQKNVVKSMESFQRSNGDAHLEYIAAAPILSPRKQVLGVLIGGKQVVQNFSFQELIAMFPDLDMRIYIHDLEDNRYELAYSSIPGMSKNVLSEQLEATEKNRPSSLASSLRTTVMFNEKINQEPYKSKAVILRNYLREPIGYLVVSTSETGLRDIKAKNILYMALYILFGVSVAILAGTWFKRRFVNPLKLLCQASEKVSQGHLDASVEEASDQYEVQHTLSSFNNMLKKLREEEHSRGTFVSTLTHDLRTPLIAQKRVLKMYNQFGSELPPEMASLNSQLLKNNDHLLDMVNKVLESYQYEAGKINITPEHFSLKQLVDECVDEVRPLAQEKDITLLNQVPDSKPPAGLPELFADRHQVKRLLQNLIGNAVEHIGEQRQIQINAHLRSDQRIQVEVRDNGLGISPELLPHLFTRYFTGNRLRQKIGSGLGLYICRMIVELHGGSIEAKSIPRQGTTILFDLPSAASG